MTGRKLTNLSPSRVLFLALPKGSSQLVKADIRGPLDPNFAIRRKALPKRQMRSGVPSLQLAQGLFIDFMRGPRERLQVGDLIGGEGHLDGTPWVSHAATVGAASWLARWNGMIASRRHALLTE